MEEIEGKYKLKEQMSGIIILTKKRLSLFFN